jgi:hypothetical protein
MNASSNVAKTLMFLLSRWFSADIETAFVCRHHMEVSAVTDVWDNYNGTVCTDL